MLIVPTLSSYEAFLSDFAEAAMAGGHEVHVATQLKLLDGRSVEEHPTFKSGVLLHPISMPRGSNPFAALKAAKELRGLVSKIQPDWIQAHFSAAAFVCALAKSKDWPFTSCVIQGLACTLARGKARWAAWFGERLAMARLDEMWVLTDDDFAVIQSWNSKKARRQQAPGFGCRLDRFDSNQYSSSWRHARRAALAISEQDEVLIYVGRLAAFKGFDKVVHAYQKLKQKGAPVRLLILGAFDLLHASGLTTEEIQALKQDPSVIQPGWQENVAEWLAISDLCVFPSEREGMPVCLMEALCMAVPVVTSNSRGCRDVVQDGVDGYVLRDASVSNLAAQIEGLMNSPELLDSLRLGALAGRARFDRARFVAEQLASLSNLLATD
ncbi:MAG: glycosyltransferase [Opitutae bacterium]|nr:glycosyltransferase [Opitutae bacterium]